LWKSSKTKSIISVLLAVFWVFGVILLHPQSTARSVFGSTLYTDSRDIQETRSVNAFLNESISQLRLIPGGFPFGVKFYTKGVVVVGLSDVETENGFISPADSAGFKKGDIIISTGGNEVNTIEEIAAAIEQCAGQNVSFTVTRGNETLELSLTPVKSQSDGKYKSGMWIRDSTAGIGTVTYIQPETLAFGGLGHGICDSDTGTIMPLFRGSVVNVEISDIVRGITGRPGELKGDFGTEKTGSLTANSGVGVFGVFSNLPKKTAYKSMPVAPYQEICEGSAQIYSSIRTGENNIYDIEITKINPDDIDCKNFVIHVTDKRLIDLTGGIIQGMSGSPIIQNGKLVGAVTHVFVNDPTRGYGIFIENMLTEAEKIK